jgi:hypothetical protein
MDKQIFRKISKIAIVIVCVILVGGIGFWIGNEARIKFIYSNKVLTTEDIAKFAKTYGWTPPYGFTKRQLIQFMKDNPNATSKELEEGARETQGKTKDNQSNNEYGTPPPEVMSAIKEMESTQPPRIRGDETEEEVYNNPYIKHIRVALNGYLDGSNLGTEESFPLGITENCGLDKFDRSYYKSKFIVFNAEDSKYGGLQTWIVFVDKPDALFWTWVYNLGWDNKTYSLRGFCKVGPPEDKKEKFIELIKDLSKDGAMTL